MNINTMELKKKVCTECTRELIANTENFGNETKGKYGLMSKCKPCVKKIRRSKSEQKNEYDRKRYTEKREEILAYQRIYTSEHKDDKKEYDKRRREGTDRESILQEKREYHHKFKEKFKHVWKAHREKSKDKRRAYGVEYNKNNKERQKVQNTLWRINNRDRDTILKQRYKARKENLASGFTEDQWVKCKNAFDKRCAYCGKERKLVQEHFIPVSKGGEYTLNNIVPSCQSCNSSKRDKEFKSWYRTMDCYSEEREKQILNYLRYKNDIQQLALL